jgi:hypothetical protein
LSLRSLKVVLGALAMLLGPMLGNAAAQTITHDVNGRPYTYDFKRQGQGQSALAQRSSSKNIPWDEPGKISGVPGVDDRRGTNLPPALTTAARKPAATDQLRTPTATRERQDRHSGGAAQSEKVEVRAKTSDDAFWPKHLETNPAVQRAQGFHQPVVRSPAAKDTLSTQNDGADIRAKVIAESAAKALAEEQRRLALEKSRDRQTPYLEARSSPVLSEAEQGPATTGTIAAGVPGPAEPALAPASRASTGICRLLFFGAC